jgi:hypothetical protein
LVAAYGVIGSRVMRPPLLAASDAEVEALREVCAEAGLAP